MLRESYIQVLILDSNLLFLHQRNAAAGIQITGIDAFENNGRTSATGHAALWPDSSTHMWKANNNGGGTYLIPGMVGSADYSGTGSASGTLVASTLAGVYVIFISQFSAGVQNATTWTLAVGGVTCGAVKCPQWHHQHNVPWRRHERWNRIFKHHSRQNNSRFIDHVEQ